MSYAVYGDDLFRIQCTPTICTSVLRMFGMSCDDVMKAMVDQMNACTGPDGCADGGEKCWYEVRSS